METDSVRLKCVELAVDLVKHFKDDSMTYTEESVSDSVLTTAKKLSEFIEVENTTGD